MEIDRRLLKVAMLEQQLDGRRRLQADAWQNSGARHRRTTHDLYSAKLCYRHHPFYDTQVEVVRYLRRTNPAILVVKLPAGPQLAVPGWMLSPLVGEPLMEEAEPRIAIAALQELRQLIDPTMLTSVSEFLIGQNLL